MPRLSSAITVFKAVGRPLQVALTVVMAAKGYPGAYAKGGVISGVEDVSTAKVWAPLRCSSAGAPHQLALPLIWSHASVSAHGTVRCAQTHELT